MRATLCTATASVAPRCDIRTEVRRRVAGTVRHRVEDRCPGTGIWPAPRHPPIVRGTTANDPDPRRVSGASFRPSRALRVAARSTPSTLDRLHSEPLMSTYRGHSLRASQRPSEAEAEKLFVCFSRRLRRPCGRIVRSESEGFVDQPNHRLHRGTTDHRSTAPRPSRWSVVQRLAPQFGGVPDIRPSHGRRSAAGEIVNTGGDRGLTRR